MISDLNILDKSDKEYIENVILNYDFPYFLSKSQVDDDDSPFFSHNVLERPEDRGENKFFNSSTGPFFQKLLERFCKNNNIELKEFLRCCINISFHLKSKKSKLHVDHEYEHKQIILYLNDADGDTVLVHGDKNGVSGTTSIKPQKYKMVCFDNIPHYINYPTNGYRAVVVFTFR